ncbi:hypothetical protein SBA1_570012 [Candidatus Sulfotelmatobacter kueseliae]|uniref:Uncharacterized protein n=1 Tax=Candidatus Sulfotelmatobacter kueseliae TaxID=2042962 RepID=A0A2U3L099_9BACT|nr:hypothetical protein SBA1_570012 [Candidatus Sulfotelmatobacter kueseliae]
MVKKGGLGHYPPHRRIDPVAPAAYDESSVSPWLSQSFMIPDARGGNACGACSTPWPSPFPRW